MNNVTLYRTTIDLDWNRLSWEQDYLSMCKDLAYLWASETCSIIISGSTQPDRVGWVDLFNAKAEPKPFLFRGVFLDKDFGPPSPLSKGAKLHIAICSYSFARTV